MLVVNMSLLVTFVLVVLLWGFNWVTIWSGVPLLSAAVLSEMFLTPTKGEWTKASINRKFRIIGMVCGAILITLYFHLSLYFGWIESVSLRAGQKLMLVPLYAFLGGIFGITAGHILGNRLNPYEEQQEAEAILSDNETDRSPPES